jgi:general secretion pathway protein A
VYTSFYNLDKKPFQISSDPAFMWFGEKHKEALATLEYGILDNKGFLLLTGDVGTGKTTLINTLLQRLGQDVICTTVPDPGLGKMDFFNFIAAGFGIDREFQTKGVFLAYFKRFLLQASEAGKKVLLIIDEAQLLTQEMLEEIRLLSNIEKSDAKLINIFFVGQNEFNEILNREQNRAVRQRLTLNYNIDPLTPDETADYITYRLQVAGAGHTIFEDAATREIFIFSGGFPRRINVLCDHCLLSGYVKEQKIIDTAIVRECAKELKIPAYIRHRDIDDFTGSLEGEKPAVKAKTHPLPGKQPEKKKGLTGISIIVFLLVLFGAGFYVFPDAYGGAADFVTRQFAALKHRTMELMPDRDAALLSDGENALAPPEKNGQNVRNQNAPTFEIPKNNDVSQSLPTGQADAIARSEVPEQQAAASQKKKVSQPAGTDAWFRAETVAPWEPAPAPGKRELHQAALKTNVNTQAPEDTKIPEDTNAREKIPPLPDDKLVIRFKYNSNDFTQTGYDELVAYADILARHPDLEVVVSGYTDSEGNTSYNQKLSEFRANIVGSFLLGKGIGPHQMEIRGLGSENPIESNDTSRGRMMNRRVEIEIKNTAGDRSQ